MAKAGELEAIGLEGTAAALVSEFGLDGARAAVQAARAAHADPETGEIADEPHRPSWARRAPQGSLPGFEGAPVQTFTVGFAGTLELHPVEDVDVIRALAFGKGVDLLVSGAVQGISGTTKDGDVTRAARVKVLGVAVAP